MRTAIILFVLFFTCPQLWGQVNLVKNGGFEQYWHCPYAYSGIRCANFWGPIDTIDIEPLCLSSYCNACDTTYHVGVPNGEPAYYHYARSGNGMVEAILYFDNSFVIGGIREYLQGRFFSDLIAGKTYCITFYVTLGHCSQYSNNKIGAYMDNGTIDMGQDSAGCGLPQTAFIPQVVEDSIINDTLNWVKIQSSYTATGTEKFITVGTFYSNAAMDTNKRVGLFWCDTYSLYLIDDVSVISSDAVADAGTNQWVSPGSDSAFIGIPDEGMPNAWYIVGNPTPICYGSGGFKVHPDTTTKYAVVLDLCGHVTSDTVTVFVAPAGIYNLKMYQFENLKVYPNPATKQITIEGAQNCEVVIYDVIGNKIDAITIMNKQQTIDISMLKNGLYTIEIIDRETGMRVLMKVAKD